MTKKGFFVGIISILLVFTAVVASAEPIAGYFQCVDDDAVRGASITLGSDGSCILVDPNDGTRMRGTYRIDGSPKPGWTGTITFTLSGQTFPGAFIGWPASGNLTIIMDDWTFERR